MKMNNILTMKLNESNEKVDDLWIYTYIYIYINMNLMLNSNLGVVTNISIHIATFHSFAHSYFSLSPFY